MLQTTGSKEDVENVEEQFINEIYIPDFLLVKDDGNEEGCGGVTKKRKHSDDGTGTLLTYYMCMYYTFACTCRY